MAVSKSRMLEIANTITSPVFIDDHDLEEINVAAVAVLTIGEQNYIAPLLRNALFCINGASKELDGAWHLCRWSLSGNMDTRGVSIQDAITAFNDGYRQSGGDFSGDMHELTLVREF